MDISLYFFKYCPHKASVHDTLVFIYCNKIILPEALHGSVATKLKKKYLPNMAWDCGVTMGRREAVNFREEIPELKILEEVMEMGKD